MSTRTTAPSRLGLGLGLANANANPNPNPNPNPYQDEIRTFEGEPHPTSPFEGIALMDVVLRMARLQGEADCPRTGRELLEMTRAARYW